MRLTNKERQLIKKAFVETFGGGKIYLFGSRVDDTKGGGDIDLYLVPENKDELRKKKIEFLVKLDEYIGEQKVDTVIAKDSNRPIEQEAIKNGVNLMDNKLKLVKYLKECKKHSIRIEKSYNKVINIFPLSAKKYEMLNDNEVEAIDQYLFRFAKLQDTLGQRVFKVIVSEYVENINKLTFIDILNHLEQIGVLEDANTWKKLRAVRNDISHQYDDDSQEMSEALNNIFAYKDEFIKIFDDIYTFCIEKFDMKLKELE
jgi:predicted nucleotidyltransferase